MIEFNFEETLKVFNKTKLKSGSENYKETKKDIFDKHINRGWVKKYVLDDYEKNEIYQLMEKASEIKNSAATLVILCPSNVMFALKALIEPLKNSVSDILFLGDSLSASNLFGVLDQIKDRSVYLYVISDEIDRPEIGAHFRIMYQWLEKKYGITATDRIVVCTREGSNFQKLMAPTYIKCVNYEKDFPLEYVAFHPVAYIPLYVAGIEFYNFVSGAKNMIKMILDENNKFFSDYVLIRWCALQQGIELENICTFEPNLEWFCKWRSCLKGNDMIYHGSSLFIRDLDMLKYYHNNYKNKMMETFIDFTVPTIDIVVRPVQGLEDNLSELDNVGFNQLNYSETERIINDHASQGMYINHIRCGILNTEVMGSLSIFFILAGLGVNELIEKYKQKDK